MRNVQCLVHPTGRFWSFFFNKTFRISYWHLIEQLWTLRRGIGAIWKNNVFSTGPPTKSKWKRCNLTDGRKQGAPVKRLSFVYSNDNNNREGFVESIKFFFMSMKKRDNNPIGALILEDLKETAEGLYKHLMKGDNKSEDLVAEKITQDINQHLSGGYNIIWNDTLNHFLMDFDIIWIPKNHIGYNTWSDVPMEQRELCYRGYNRKVTLPHWNIEQEGYWWPDQLRSWTRGILMIWSIKKYSDHMPLVDLFHQECASCVSKFSNYELFHSLWLRVSAREW